MELKNTASNGALRMGSATGLAAILLTVTGVFGVPVASANHPVLVEGTCLGPGAAQRTTVPPGTCGDYDGDGRIGIDEDNDGPDRVFGTINAALGAGPDNTGANQNGRVLIVASGIFPEVVQITAANGNVTLEAAPGVEANVDAVVQGDPGSGARQAQPGIVIDAPDHRSVTIRNIVSRNWTKGILIRGNSHVTLDGVRVENNVDYGIRVVDNADVAITGSQVNATGYRASPAGNFPSDANIPMPGTGIAFEGQSTGYVARTTITGSFGVGLDGNRVRTLENVRFDNNRGGRGGQYPDDRDDREDRGGR